MVAKYPKLDIPTPISEQHAPVTEEAQASSRPNTSQDTNLESSGDVDWLTNLQVENTDLIIEFDQKTGGAKSIRMKNYQNDEKTGPYELVVAGLGTEASMPGKTRQEPFFAEKLPQGAAFWRVSDGWEYRQTFTLNPAGYGLNVEYAWTNKATTARELESIAQVRIGIPQTKSSQGFFPGTLSTKPLIVAGVGGSVDREDATNYCEGKETKDIFSGQGKPVEFLGIDDHYFVKAFLPQAPSSDFRVYRSLDQEGKCVINQSWAWRQGQIQPGETRTAKFSWWLGPKLDKEMDEFHPKLGGVYDYGFFSALAKPLLYALRMVESIVGNWGVAIIVLTLLIKLLLFPINQRAIASQQAMQKIQPELKKLQEKYKSDPLKQQQETMKFMSQANVNPIKGCLPALIQIPFFIAMFRILQTSIELRHAPFIGWLTDLSTYDHFYVVPVLSFILGHTQMRIMPSTGGDQVNERIIRNVLPVMFSLFMIQFPVGLALHSMVNSTWTILQSLWLKKKSVPV